MDSVDYMNNKRLIRVFSACQVINMKCQDLFSLENKNKRNIWNAVLYSPKDYGKKKIKMVFAAILLNALWVNVPKCH